jgi:toxin ParE1/3/4
LLAAAEWIADANRAVADGLIDAVEAAAERIGEHPRLAIDGLSLPEAIYRFVMLSRYSYILVYRDDLTPPEIVRMLHAARDLPRLLRDLL